MGAVSRDNGRPKTARFGKRTAVSRTTVAKQPNQEPCERLYSLRPE
jgi:hypothetical protein